jgi:hypothetical protein
MCPVKKNNFKKLIRKEKNQIISESNISAI